MYGRGTAQPNFGGNVGGCAARGGGEGHQPMPNMGPPPAVGSSGGGRSMNIPHTKFSMDDRRQLFAHMKYSQAPSIMRGGSSHHGSVGMSSHSTGDGMPDIHMVESQL